MHHLVCLELEDVMREVKASHMGDSNKMSGFVKAFAMRSLEVDEVEAV